MTTTHAHTNDSTDQKPTAESSGAPKPPVLKKELGAVFIRFLGVLIAGLLLFGIGLFALMTSGHQFPDRVGIWWYAAFQTSPLQVVPICLGFAIVIRAVEHATDAAATRLRNSGVLS